MRLTDKQRAFINHYLQCLNATEAAARAGYNGTRESLAVIGSHNLNKVKIRQEIDRRLKKQTMKADEVLFRLNQHAEGLPPEVFDVMGTLIGVDFEKIKELGLTHLIKEVSYDTNGRPRVKFYDSQNALIQLGKHYALFTDKVKHEDWQTEAIEYIRRGEIDYGVLADEFGPSLAEELFRLAGIAVEPTGASAEEIEEEDS